MKGEASKYGCLFHAFSFDGQDRDTGADYLLTDADRFAIVEFKYSETHLVSEKSKLKRLTLCKELMKRKDMRSLHDSCHFITWSEKPSGSVKTNIYRHEICNKAVFGSSSGLTESKPMKNQRFSADRFAEAFFSSNSDKSLSLAEFESYLAWVLTDTAASTISTLELIARNPKSNELAIVRLKSIAQTQEWVKSHVG